LNAQRDEVEAALALAKDVQATIQNLAQFAARGGSNAGPGTGLFDRSLTSVYKLVKRLTS